MDRQFSAAFESQDLSKQIKIMKIMWGSMLFSLLVYFLISLGQINIFNIVLNKELSDKIRPILYVISIITLIATRFIRKLWLKKGPVSPLAPNPEIARYRGAMVISLSLSEAIGVYGVILYAMGKNKTDLYLLLLVAVAAMIMYRPKKGEIINLAQEEIRP